MKPIFLEFEPNERNGSFIKSPLIIDITKITSIYENSDGVIYISLSNGYGWYVNDTLENVMNRIRFELAANNFSLT